MSAQYFTFVSNSSLLNFLAGAVASDFTVPFTRTVAGGSDWEVDVITYRLKYVGTNPKIYQMTARFQQTSSTNAFRPNVQMYRSPTIDGNTGIIMLAGGGTNGIMDAYPVTGNFITIQPNQVCVFTTENRNTGFLAGTSTDFTFTVFLNELR